MTLHSEIWLETEKPRRMMDTRAFIGDDHHGLPDTCWVGGSLPRSIPELHVNPGFHQTTNATNITQKQRDYNIEQSSSFTLIALFALF